MPIPGSFQTAGKFQVAALVMSVSTCCFLDQTASPWGPGLASLLPAPSTQHCQGAQNANRPKQEKSMDWVRKLSTASGQVTTTGPWLSYLEKGGSLLPTLRELDRTHLGLIKWPLNQRLCIPLAAPCPPRYRWRGGWVTGLEGRLALLLSPLNEWRLFYSYCLITFFISQSSWR